MEKMIQIAESYGWAVDMDSDSIEFNQCSPANLWPLPKATPKRPVWKNILPSLRPMPPS